MQTYTHFRCAFDVSSTENLPNAWPALIGEIRAWVSRKEKTPVGGWFFSGGTWSGKGQSRARVEVKTITDAGPTPAMWALRYEHLDYAVAVGREGLGHYPESGPILVNTGAVLERRGVTPETAMRLARFFGGDARSWLNIQIAFDLRTTEIARAEEIERSIEPRQRSA